MKLRRIAFYSLIIFYFFSCSNNNSSKLIIATSANMQFAMKEIIQTFAAQSNIECETVISSSGKLTSQIIEGAPYHVFVSANLKYPNTVFEKGFANHPPKIYAQGKLVLWSWEKSIPNLNELTSPEIKKIAIANPKNAPYGKATIEVLQKLELFEKIKDKIVYGESISQVNQFVFSKAASVGFTSKSAVLSDRMIGKGYWLGIHPVQHAIQPFHKFQIDNNKFRIKIIEWIGSL